MKRVLVLFAVCLFVITQFSIAFAKKDCDDPSNYTWDPKSGECIEKITGPKCPDPSKERWDPETKSCIEK